MRHTISLSPFAFSTLIFFSLASCSFKKNSSFTTFGNDSAAKIPPTAVSEVPETTGFFLNEWQAKTFTAPEYSDVVSPASANSTVTIDAGSVITKIPSPVFGHNANVWMTRMIDQPALLTHLSNLKPHVIRFPAGSGSNRYFWNRREGDLPADVPEMIMDKDGIVKEPGYFYGKGNYHSHASLDDYYAVLNKTGSQGMITVNYGYARYGTSKDPVATAAHLAADWVRYDKGRTPYWEIGNENFADWENGYRIDLSKNKDGQPEFLTGDLYARHFKVFADSMRKAAAEIGKTIYIGAVMFETKPESFRADIFKTWNTTMLPALKGTNDYYVLHNYFTPYRQNTNATAILTAAGTVPGSMMRFAQKQIKTFGGTEKPIALTEWNMFAEGSKQQVSNVSGLFSVIVQGEAIKHKYGMAGRWDLLNAWSGGDDHGLFSDGKEPGVTKWSPRPSFYYMYYFQKTIGDRLVGSSSTAKSLKTYASTYSSGELAVAVVNTATRAQKVKLKIKNFSPGRRMYWYSLEGGSDNGEFSRKVSVNRVTTKAVAGGPENYTSIKANSSLTSDSMRVEVPARGTIFLVVEK